VTTKQSKKRTTQPPDTETEQTPGQKYEAQLRQVLDEWAEKALEMLAEDIRALDRQGVLEIRPRTSAALLRRLESIGGDAVRSWVKLPPRPKPAEYPPRVPSKEDTARAEQRHRIEQSYVYKLDVRRFVNEDRARGGLPPLPPSEDEASTSDK